MSWDLEVDQQAERLGRLQLHGLLTELVDLKIPVTIHHGTQSYGYVSHFNQDHFTIQLDEGSIYDYWVFPNMMLWGVKLEPGENMVVNVTGVPSRGKLRAPGYHEGLWCQGAPLEERADG